MIRRLLIANRGEIAIRIIRGCRELGVETVAVYSDADRHAPHVAAADRAVDIGPSPPAESYLSIARLMAAAQVTDADALHPGYGFLSENPALADACERARIVFVGPPSAVIRMGSKIEACRPGGVVCGLNALETSRRSNRRAAAGGRQVGLRC